MVGRLRSNTLTVFGLATAPEWGELLDDASDALATPLTLSRLPDGYGPSDHASFYGRGIPVLHFFTNTHEDYHRPSDDWQLVNAEGIERIAGLVTEVTIRLAGTSGRLPTTPTLVLTQPPAPPGVFAHGERGRTRAGVGAVVTDWPPAAWMAILPCASPGSGRCGYPTVI